LLLVVERVEREATRVHSTVAVAAVVVVLTPHHSKLLQIRSTQLLLVVLQVRLLHLAQP
jgi:hypothetical protein